MLQLTGHGLYCSAGGFYIDPWLPVERAIVTHAHGDHARPGSERYLGSEAGLPLLRRRLGADAHIAAIPYGERVRINDVSVSLHPAGHILGSAQVRLERDGEVWVVSGDYKTVPDPTCAPFEPLQCHTFITEATFGLPIYRWPTPEAVFAEINAWWRANRTAGRASMLFAYALGKAQRVLAGVDGGIGPIYVHGAVHGLTEAYREGGVSLPSTTYVHEAARGAEWSTALIVAPESAQGTPWLRRFGPVSTGFASGWMRVRGQRRRRSIDRGFVLSDHADWPGLLDAIRATGATRVYVTHGYSAVLARYLAELGLDARTLETRFEGETADAEE